MASSYLNFIFVSVLNTTPTCNSPVLPRQLLPPANQSTITQQGQSCMTGVRSNLKTPLCLLWASIFVGSFVFYVNPLRSMRFQNHDSCRHYAFIGHVFFLSSVCFEHGNTQQWSPVPQERTGQLRRQGYGQPSNHSRWGSLCPQLKTLLHKELKDQQILHRFLTRLLLHHQIICEKLQNLVED